MRRRSTAGLVDIPTPTRTRLDEVIQPVERALVHASPSPGPVIGPGRRPYARGPPADVITLEHEADLIASRVRHGHRGSWSIHRALLARSPRPLGMGRALPCSIRARTEAALVADLSSVRIHDDVTAASLAHAYGARALTFGTDIIFGTNQFAPGHANGHELLLHELVHVLQQTGERSANGHWSCRSSSPATHRPQTKLVKPEFKDKAPTLQKLGEDYTSITGGDTNVTSWVEQITKAQEPGGDLDKTVRELGEAALETGTTGNVAAFACDVLKSRGKYSTAIKILGLRTGLQTTFHDAKMLDHAPSMIEQATQDQYPTGQGQFAWIVGMWGAHPKLDKLRPEQFLSSILTWLLGPTRAPPTLGEIVRDPSTPSVPGKPEPKYFEAWAEVELDHATSTSLRENELFLFSLWSIARFNQIRLSVIEDAAKAGTKRVTSGEKRREAANYVYRWADAVSTGTATKEFPDPRRKKEHGSVAGLMIIFANKIRSAGAAASEIWASAVDAMLVSQLTDNITLLGTTAGEFLKYIGKESRLEDFRDKLIEVSAEALSWSTTPPLQPIPGRSEYSIRMKKLGNALDSDLKYHFEFPLLSTARKIGEAMMSGVDWKQAIDLKLTVARAYVHTALDLVRVRITEYDHSADLAQESSLNKRAKTALLKEKWFTSLKQPQQAEILASYDNFPDYRARHRLQLAVVVKFLGLVMDVPELLDIAQEVVAPGEPLDPIEKMSGEARAQHLMIVGDYMEDSQPLKQILDDIGPYLQIRGYEPLRVIDVYRFLSLLEWTAVNQSLKDKLKPGGSYVDAQGNTRTDFSPDEVIPNVIDRERKSRPQPQRWVLTEMDYLVRLTPKLRKDFATLLMKHPKTRMLLLEEQQAGRPESITPIPFSTPVLVWTLPSFADLVKRLRDNKTLDQFVRKYNQSKFDKEQAEKAAKAKADADEQANKPKQKGNKEPPAIEPKPEEAPSVDGMDAETWLQLLREALEAQTKAAEAAAQKAKKKPVPGAPDATGPPSKSAEQSEIDTVFDQLAKDRDLIVEEVTKNLREASIRTRQYFTETLFRPLVEKSGQHMFDKVSADKKEYGKFLVYSIPETLHSQLWRLSSLLTPIEDQDAHLAATVAALAKTLHDKWKKRKEFDLISTWIPVVEHTIAFLEHPSDMHGKSSSLDTVQTSAERSQQTEDKKHLVALHSAWLVQMRSVSLEHGFIGAKGGGDHKHGLVKPARGGAAVVAGLGDNSVFQINGIVYAIHKVYEDFAYFHPYRRQAKLGQKDSSGDETSAPDSGTSILFIGEPDSRKEIPAYEQDRKDIRLLQYRRGTGGKEDLYAHEDGKLADLSNAVGLHAVVASLQALADALEAAAGLIMDALELIPGVGQAAAAARIATAVLTFMAGDSFTQLISLVRDDPKQVLVDAFEKLKTQLFDPTKLWEFLLFKRFDLTGLESAKQSDNSIRQQYSQGKLRRIINKVAALGRKLGGLFIRFQRRVVGLVDRARIFVLSHPILARVIRGIGKYLHILAHVSFVDVFGKALDKDPMTKLHEGVRSFGSKIRGFFLGISKLKLPKTIIPLDAVLEIIVDILVRRIGGKYKYAVRGFMEILELTGKKRDLMKAISSEFLDNTALDPNTYIAEELKNQITEHTQTASGSLFDMLKDNIAPKVKTIVGSNDFSEGLGDKPKVEAELDTGGEEIEADSESVEADEPTEPAVPAVQPARIPGGKPQGRLPAMPSANSGQRLAPELEQRLETKLGHDLTHVRVHDDQTSKNLTHALAAHAVTSGSHVFVRPDLKLDSELGDRVLAHEVGHVLQQTGARPLGSLHDARPRLGATGMGMVLDSAKESEADDIANMVTSGTGRQRPLAVPAKREMGLQPSLLENVVGPLFHQVSGTEALVERAAKDASTGDREGRVSLDNETKKSVLAIWSKIAKQLEPSPDAAGTKLLFDKPFDKVEALIRNRFKTRHDDLRSAVGDVALHAMEPLKPENPEHDPVEVMHPSRFQTGLVGHILGSTGIVLDLDLREKKVKIDGAKHPNQSVVDDSAPLRSVKVKHVYLADVYGGDELWKEAITKTWPTLTKPEEQAAMRARVRGVVQEWGISSEVWDADEFKFSKKLVDRVDELIKNAEAKQDKLEPSQLPPKETKGNVIGYLDTKKADTDPTKNIGLRIGLFGQHENPKRDNKIKLPNGEEVEAKGQQKGLERESHHTTQFLLFEFFRNEVEKELAFPIVKDVSGTRKNKHDSKVIYPGLSTSDGFVDTFAHTKTFHIGDYYEKRGGRMPAILIARTTHRTGNLHVTPKSIDFADVDTQGGAVRAVFREKLGGEEGEYCKAEKQALEPKKTAAGGVSASVVSGPKAFQEWVTTKGESKVKGTIETAMLETYRWMYFGKMEAALRAGLSTIEKDYYNDLAEASGSKERISKDEMETVANEARENNIKHLKLSGFEL